MGSVVLRPCSVCGARLKDVGLATGARELVRKGVPKAENGAVEEFFLCRGVFDIGKNPAVTTALGIGTLFQTTQAVTIGEVPFDAFS